MREITYDMPCVKHHCADGDLEAPGKSASSAAAVCAGIGGRTSAQNDISAAAAAHIGRRCCTLAMAARRTVSEKRPLSCRIDDICHGVDEAGG